MIKHITSNQIKSGITIPEEPKSKKKLVQIFFFQMEKKFSKAKVLFSCSHANIQHNCEFVYFSPTKTSPKETK